MTISKPLILTLGLLPASIAGASGVQPISFQELRGVGGPGTIELEFTGIAGGGSEFRVQVGSRALQAGHITHNVLSGPNAGSEFRTFCVEVNQNIGQGPQTYNIQELTDAPSPGGNYTQAEADGVSAVLANAVALGWIDNRLQADTSQSDYIARMGAIQAAIWAEVDLGVDVFSANTNAAIRQAYLELTDAGTFDASLRLNGLRALTNPRHQDMLYVVPLPPAAMAGLGMLGVCLGVRAWRRR